MPNKYKELLFVYGLKSSFPMTCEKAIWLTITKYMKFSFEMKEVWATGMRMGSKYPNQECVGLTQMQS